MIFGKLIKKNRLQNKLSARELSQACGVSRSYITLMENGKRLPGKKVIPKLALALNVKTNMVVNWYLEEIREKLLD